ncbi:MAG: phytanoyl-CoA dioxygenase family protein [Nitrospiraceae bacterium]
MNRAGTRWLQDQVFQSRHRPMNSLHFWIPLKDVDEVLGCLHFIP